MNLKKNRAKINYVVDIIIGLGFIAAAISGIVLLLAGTSGGYQGGRNPQYAADILGFSRQIWKSLHNWSSIGMIAAVLGHLILHWNWMVCMTRNLFGRHKQVKKATTPCAV